MGGRAHFATVEEVRAWLLDPARDAVGQRGILDDQGRVLLQCDRATVCVVAPGQPAPDAFEHLLVVGAPEELHDALVRLDDPRVHLLGLPCGETVLERVVRSARQAAQSLSRSSVTEKLLDVGLALNTERDPARVLSRILEHARSITGADAGSIYLVDSDQKQLRFKVAVNESIETDFGEHTLPVRSDSVVGTCVLRRTVIRSAELYPGDEGADEFSPHSTGQWARLVDDDTNDGAAAGVKHDRSIDQQLGYQTRSMITAPMISPQGPVLAVIQLINAKSGSGPLRTAHDFDTRVHPFTEQDERLCSSLAGQAAVALENARLYAEIQSLFEGFVRASVHAIEQRDPTTSGHSQRVADLTVALAQAADRARGGRFDALRFSAQQLREIEYAGLLHDFGKVGVREEVLVKAKKLYPAQLELVRARFDHMRTALEVERLRAQNARLRAGHPEDPAIDEDFARRVAEHGRMLAIITEANEPTVLPTDVSSQLSQIADHRFCDAAGNTHALLSGDELSALLIRRGSLTEQERVEIQHHVTHTYDFLVRIPWGESLRLVPEIAAKHHEYLDGSGYPSRLPEPQIPIQARMMTVADIFDALTAADRPYKKAVPIPLALDILHAERDRGKIDPDVLELFVEAKVFAGGTSA